MNPVCDTCRPHTALHRRMWTARPEAPEAHSSPTGRQRRAPGRCLPAEVVRDHEGDNLLSASVGVRLVLSYGNSEIVPAVARVEKTIVVLVVCTRKEDNETALNRGLD